MKIRDLIPGMRRVNINVEVVDVSEPKEVTSRRIKRSIVEAKVKDETGMITLVLWDDKIIHDLKAGEKLQVRNGFVSSFKGDMRVNIGEYAEIERT
ncbi:MAG: OB-fold nucleic acid binding domain-containing protein [Candidatus Bathyarchaeota archaeon]|nr:OB-fold nucleic acid binding domain-containing protein [Candidatus Bathyarchaeota archaeon]